MTITPDTLLQRLENIAGALQASGHALALLALGSVGQELQRLDAWSDLDFFVIVEPGHKARYIDSLDWLAAAHPLAWHYRNTADGHKVLMTDGVFCEFAIFEPHELAGIPYAPGRIVWRRDEVDPGLAVPRRQLPAPGLPDYNWLVGEVLSCLLVGLSRWRRGERLSATRFVQGHAVDRLIELDQLLAPPPADAAVADPFNRERRLEKRQPALAAELPALVPGYDDTPAAALAMLQALRRRGVAIAPALADKIDSLARGAGD